MELILRNVIPSDALSLAHILVAANEHAFRGLVPDQCLEFSEAESTTNWQRTLSQGLPKGDFMILATLTTGEAIGYTWGGTNIKERNYAGEIRQISVLPAYQGQGIGRQLIHQLVKRLIEQGLHSMSVEVLRINPNRAFYERLGATFVSEHPYDWDGVNFSECVYGWADIRPLLTAVAD